MRFALVAAEVYTPNGIELNQVVVIENGKIAEISTTVPTDCEVINLAGQALMPGFVDIHIHGRHGHDVMDATDVALDGIAQALPSTGVTAWVGTTVTAPWQDIITALTKMRSYIAAGQTQGAELLGSFLEGPYFTERHRGSHPSRLLKSPEQGELEQLKTVAGESLLRVAIAPEADNAMASIKWLTANNIKTSVAHTNANFAQVTEAFELGADCGVHLFNGMSGLHHREPGCCGAVLYHDMLAELIADDLTPEFLVTLHEEFQRLMDSLPDEQLLLCCVNLFHLVAD
ncbi:MAG: amidohydrolase family protein [Moritella sp.]|uniref:N-acetylglucosamine-6-phosphate deacetylase n=1 Tax=Moritella sp. TaxID=78556 RepID=UPI001D76B015|nr:amidohydrolase family protein [Moritella sp.]NQZ52107.1 amidohydrolase family protein [Moritella sp.]